MQLEHRAGYLGLSVGLLDYDEPFTSQFEESNRLLS